MEEYLQVYNPYNQELIGKINYMTAQEIDAALARSHHYFINQSEWLKPHQRVQVLQSFLHQLKTHQDELIQIASEESGKPIIDTNTEFNRAVEALVTAIETIPQLTGREIPMGLSKASDNRLAFTTRQPVGVVFAISAFNHPINLIIHHIVPAIACGCPVLIKPSLFTPLSCIKIIELLYQAGLPKPLCQLILCNDEYTERLVSDPRIAFLSFTGTSKVGWYLRSKLAPGAQCILIHGSASPTILFEDANLDLVLPLILRGGFNHAGQTGASVQRLFVHSKIIKSVSKKLTELTQKIVVGDPKDSTTEMGPLISTDATKRVEAWVNQAIEHGAKCLTGGNKLTDTLYAPTLLYEPPHNVKVSQEEIFGPVICIYGFKDRMEAINKANALPFCFHASVMTQNFDIAMDTINQLHATCVMVNDHSAFHVDWMPYGGRRHSGTGVGGIVSTMKALTYEKMMLLKLNRP